MRVLDIPGSPKVEHSLLRHKKGRMLPCLDDHSGGHASLQVGNLLHKLSWSNARSANLKDELVDIGQFTFQLTIERENAHLDTILSFHPKLDQRHFDSVTRCFLRS